MYSKTTPQLWPAWKLQRAIVPMIGTGTVKPAVIIIVNLLTILVQITEEIVGPTDPTILVRTSHGPLIFREVLFDLLENEYSENESKIAYLKSRRYSWGLREMTYSVIAQNIVNVNMK